MISIVVVTIPQRSRKTEEGKTFIDLMRYPNLRKKALIVYFVW